MEPQAINITIDSRDIAAPGWLDVDDVDDPHAWELSVRGPIDGDLGEATSGKAEDVFVIELMISHNRRGRGEGRIRVACDAPTTGMRTVVMVGAGPLEFRA